jgi:hypothetical protein
MSHCEIWLPTCARSPIRLAMTCRVVTEQEMQNCMFRIRRPTRRSRSRPARYAAQASKAAGSFATAGVGLRSGEAAHEGSCY